MYNEDKRITVLGRGMGERVGEMDEFQLGGGHYLKLENS